MEVKFSYLNKSMVELPYKFRGRHVSTSILANLGSELRNYILRLYIRINIYSTPVFLFVDILRVYPVSFTDDTFSYYERFL